MILMGHLAAAARALHIARCCPLDGTTPCTEPTRLDWRDADVVLAAAVGTTEAVTALANKFLGEAWDLGFEAGQDYQRNSEFAEEGEHTPEPVNPFTGQYAP